MELHERFKYPEMRETIFGYDPEYYNKYILVGYLRRIVILSAAVARVYYKSKKNDVENMTSRTIDRIVKREYISIDNSLSILSAIQANSKECEELGLSALKILSDESNPDYINLYELKVILNDGTCKLETARYREAINKVIACVDYITSVNIMNDGDKIFFEFGGEKFDVSDLFKFEFCYLYRALLNVDPLETYFEQL